MVNENLTKLVYIDLDMILGVVMFEILTKNRFMYLIRNKNM